MMDQWQSASQAALQRCSGLWPERSAFRLSHEDLLPGLTVDYYAGHLLLTDYRTHVDRLAALTDLASSMLQSVAQMGWPGWGATVKQRPDNLSRAAGRDQCMVIAGDPPPRRWVVKEHGLLFEVSFEDAGFGTGVFLDMAEGRRQVAERSAGRRVLNLFSYTGPFSMAAAVGGAALVIEVDTAGKWLSWSQVNQQLNGVDCVRQRKEDAMKYIGKQSSERFDLIICDPPSYANPKKGKRFTIDRGYRQMLPKLRQLLSGEGELLACCNHAGTERGQFAGWIRRSGLKLIDWVPPSADFAGTDYLKVAWCRADG